MKVIVKVLYGQEHSLEALVVNPELSDHDGIVISMNVTGQTRVLEVKKQLEDLTVIPACKQKLLLMGRPLADDKRLSDYPLLKDGTKLNLIVKPETMSQMKVNSEKPDKTEQDLSILRSAAYKFLRDFYSETETQRIVEEFGKEFLRSTSTLNLDDYERIATSCLEEEARNS